MFNPNVLRASTRDLIIIGMAGAFALAACGTSDEAQATNRNCYPTSVGQDGTSSVEGAILSTVEHEVTHSSDTEGYYGTHDAGITINQSLMPQHKNYQQVMPGDSFSICVVDKHIFPDPRADHQPVANDK